MIFLVRAHDKAVVGVNITSFVDGMVARAQPPSRIPPLISVAAGMLMVLEMGSWRQGEVHKMSDGGLALAVIEGSHGCLLRHLIIVCQLGPSTCFVFVTKWLLVSCLRIMTRS